MKKILFILIFTYCLFGRAQFTSTTVSIYSSGQDSYVNSSTATTNYNATGRLYTSWNSTGSVIERIYMRADFSSIPENAIVTYAAINMYCYSVDNTLQHPLYVRRVTGSWNESTLTWNNQPGVTQTYQTSVPHANCSATGWHTFDVTQQAQYMVNQPAYNYGWRISMQTESGTGTKGISYRDSEQLGFTSQRPYITIQYVIPIEITATVKHCTKGFDDGEIYPTVTKGSQTYSSYEWFQYDNGTVTSIESGTNIANADITGLEDGLYLLTVVDNKGTRGYKYFMIGEYGTTSVVDFRNLSNSTNSSLFNEDATLTYVVSSADGTNPGGSNTLIQTYTSSTTYYSNLVKYKVDIDSMFDINYAELRLVASTHYRQSSSVSNQSYVSRITEDWVEDGAVWSNAPTTTTTNRETIPESAVGSQSRNDTVNMKNFVEYWQQNPDENFGVEFKMSTYTSSYTAYLRYYSTDYTALNTRRPSFVISYSLPEQVISTFHDSLDVGDITINAPAGELPYTYLIGYDSIPNLADIWNGIKDSINVDSLNFFSGKSNRRSYSFNALEAETYFVAVFDNTGTRIFDSEVILTPETEFLENQNLLYVNNEISLDPISSDGKATLNQIIPKNGNGGIQFEFTQMGEGLVGFNYVQDSIAETTSQFEYAIRFNSTTRHYEIYLSDSLVFEDTLIVGDRFRLYKENYDFVAVRNFEEVSREEFFPQYNLKTDIAYAAFAKITKPSFIKPLKAKPLVVTTYNTECDAGNGSIRISFDNGYYYSGTTLAEYEIIDLNTSTVVASGTLSYPSYTTIPLPVGEYQVHLHWTNGTVDLDWSVFTNIGQPIEWMLSNNFIAPVVGSVNTIKTTTPGEEGTAISQNTLLEGINGWVTFNVGFKPYFPPSGSSPYSPIIYANLRIVDESNNQRIRVKVIGMGAYGISKYITIYDANDDPTGPSIFIGSIDGPIKIELNNGDFYVYVNNSTTPVAIESEGIPNAYKVDAIIYASNVHDSYASFCYGLSRSDICGHLDYELDGNYYVTNSGKFCFVYNEEYNDQNIQFNIYNNQQNIVADQTDFNTDNLYIGENRIVLDLTSNGFCLGTGFFILEVINDKGEHFYLRFYNGYTGCLPAYKEVGETISN